ncbi:MAG: RHS repeat-associated core domain-containing protein [Chloroherpetonaceae bacterium]|nr:RHS repeat-associated core domain-containing protein [Chloroherpetonaceae bacterium]
MPTFVGGDPTLKFLKYISGQENEGDGKLWNFRARLYNTDFNRFYALDPNGQQFSPYAFCGNSPLMFVDRNGEFFNIFGVFNLITQIYEGNIKNVFDGLDAVVSGSISRVGSTLGKGLTYSIPIIGPIIAGTDALKNLTSSLSIPFNFTNSVFSLDFTCLENSVKIFLGDYYLDETKGFWEKIGSGILQNSWEQPQSNIGAITSQWMNLTGNVDEVRYFGGVTFSVSYNGKGSGVSLGKHIWADTPNSSFDILNDPLLMHEYGHTFQSRKLGFRYLSNIGIPSLLSAMSAQWVRNDPWGARISTHDIQDFEMEANRYAADYFARYGVN